MELDMPTREDPSPVVDGPALTLREIVAPVS